MEAVVGEILRSNLVHLYRSQKAVRDRSPLSSSVFEEKSLGLNVRCFAKNERIRVLSFNFSFGPK